MEGDKVCAVRCVVCTDIIILAYDTICVSNLVYWVCAEKCVHDNKWIICENGICRHSPIPDRLAKRVRD